MGDSDQPNFYSTVLTFSLQKLVLAHWRKLQHLIPTEWPLLIILTRTFNWNVAILFSNAISTGNLRLKTAHRCYKCRKLTRACRHINIRHEFFCLRKFQNAQRLISKFVNSVLSLEGTLSRHLTFEFISSRTSIANNARSNTLDKDWLS